ncbi:MAG: hypothetical protein U0941_14180 [Planctomycetaceae bacterium]
MTHTGPKSHDFGYAFTEMCQRPARRAAICPNLLPAQLQERNGDAVSLVSRYNPTSPDLR